MSHRRCVTPSGRVESLPLTLTLYQLPRSFFGRVHTWHTRVLCALCLTCLEKDLRQFMQATRRHSTTLVAMYHPSVFGGSPLSSRHVVLRDQQQLFARARRDILFTANTGLREQEREQSTRKDGAIETQHVCTIAVKTPR